MLLDDLLDGAYDPASAGAEDIARALMRLKLDLSAFLEAGTFSDVAGKTAMLTDVRVSMEGLDHVFRTTDGMAFEARVRELLTLFLCRRFKDADVTRRKLEGDLDDEAERIAGVRAIYEAGRAEYLALDDAAGVRLAGRPVGNGAFVLSAVGAESTEATIRSLAERKGALATRVLDDIIDRSEQLDLLEKLFKVVTLGLGDLRGFEPHHLAAYTVLSLVPPQHREVLATLEFEEEAFDDVRLYAKGEGADLIEAGEFDLDRLLGR